MRIIRIDEGYVYWQRMLDRVKAYEACKGLCFWCNCQTVLYAPALGHPEKHKGEADKATLDHVYNKMDPKRAKYKKQPAVNACYPCNQRRSKEAQNHFVKA